MRRLIVSGIIYLIVIAVVLHFKPTLMFQEDGTWKEFGIGRDPAYFTYIPFWLFTIIWSLLAYLSVMLIEDSLYLPSDAIELPRNSGRTRNVGRKANNVVHDVVQELTPGYYMLNEGSTGRNGVPRYVYLGPDGPGDD
jgi:hypothetical protein